MSERFDVAALLAELTLAEKASLVSGSGFWWTRRIERVGIPSIMVSDGPHGLRKQADRTDHLGIGGSVPATCFPTASALASSWDRDLVRAVGAAIGTEARAQNVGVVLGPGINLKRSPLCGRNFEYLSEDPVIAGELGAAMVDGIQGRGVGTSLKHYAVNNQETDRLRVSAEVDDRPLRELYLAAFERVVRDAQPWTVMCSYNRINGVYASEDPWLLTEVLRGEWGFDGLVMSDWGAVEDPTEALPAGLDLEMPSTGGRSAKQIVDAVDAGSLDEAALDIAVPRLLALIERALPGIESSDDFDADAHHSFARSVAAECVVLLKNEEQLLPLSPDLKHIAIIGEFARTPRFQGAGSSKVNPTRIDDALTAIRTGLGDEVTVDFAAGFGVDDPSADNAALLDEAVAVAGFAHATVLFVGLPPSYESEGFDRTHIDLPAEQLAVIDAVAAVANQLVVVVANGSVVAVDGWQDRAGALVEGWLGGQAGGGAIADVLLGAVNPSGRLAETMPVRLQDTAAHLNFPGEDRTVRYGEGLFIGYRHHDAIDGPVSYPFGHGLSYTTFAYSGLTVRPLDAATTAVDLSSGSSPAATTGWRGAPRLEVTVTVTNTGTLTGKEVVQLYVGAPDASVSRPVRELKDFAKVTLEPGQHEPVTFTLHDRDLAYWSTRTDDWLLEPGRFEVSVGASSRDLRLTEVVAVDGPRVAYPLDRASTLAEWLDHPVGHEIVLDALRHSSGGDLTSLTEDPEQLRMLGSFPMTRVATLLGPALDVDLVDQLLARLDDPDARSTGLRTPHR